jgi:hypothetical protein
LHTGLAFGVPHQTPASNRLPRVSIILDRPTVVPHCTRPLLTLFDVR